MKDAGGMDDRGPPSTSVARTIDPLSILLPHDSSRDL